MKNKKPLESKIQHGIIERFEADGWLVIKLGITNYPGMPDLMALKNGEVRFFEVKRPGERPRPLQAYRHAQLRELGFTVQVVYE